MDTENLDDNPMFGYLKQYQNALWRTILAQPMDYLLLIPQSIALRGKLSLDLLQTHIVQPVNEQTGQFKTLNGKRITIKGKYVYTTCGFKENRVIHILYTEEYMSNDMESGNESIGVAHLDRPIEGGVSVSCNLIDFDSSIIANILRMFLQQPENDLLFSQLDKFIDKFNTVANRIIEPSIFECVFSYVVKMFQKQGFAGMTQPLIAIENAQNLIETHAFDECEPPINILIRKEIEAASASFQMWSPLYKSFIRTNSQSELCKLQIALALEAYILEHLYDSIIYWMKKCFSKEDMTFTKILDLMVIEQYSHDNLGIRQEYRCIQSNAVNIILKLPTYRTPLQKLICLKNAITHINKAVEANIMRIRQSTNEFELTTDDLLDQLIIVLLQARPLGLQGMVSQLRFIRQFHYLNLDTSILGFYLANFEVAVEWFVTKGSQMVH